MIKAIRSIRDQRAFEGIWANLSGITALLGFLLIVLTACASCQGKTPGCPRLPFSYEPHP